MAKRAFKMMMDGIEDAIAYAQGDETRGRVAHGIDAKAVRKATGLSQAKFAETYHIPVGTLRDWEQQRGKPDAVGRTFLAMVAADPDAVAKIIAKAA